MLKKIIPVLVLSLFILSEYAGSQYSKAGVAVFPFSGPEKKIAEKISAEVSSELFKSKSVTLIDRSNVDKMLKEASLGMTGLIDPASAVETGKIHGMQIMISGLYDINGISATATHMETMRVISSVSVKSTSDAAELGRKLRAGIEGYLIGETLKKMRNESKDISLDFWVQKKGSSEKITSSKTGGVKIGDSVEFHFRSGVEGYITILDIQPGGDMVILYPNDFEASGKISAGREYIIPSADSDFETIVTEPAGVDRLLIFFTTKKWDLLDPSILSGEGFKTVKDDRKEDVKRGFANIRTLKKNQWISRCIEIEVAR